jgi:signal transduction histidine kinase/ligand-binding sensor domain-containing protein
LKKPGLILLLLYYIGFPQQAVANEKFYLDMWDQSEGLSQLTVNDIVQTKDGYLWVATKAGLCRFDGVKFTIFDSRNTALMDEEIWDLEEDTDGTLWIATYGGGVTQLKNGQSKTYTVKDGLPTNIIRTVISDKRGTIWIGTLNGLVKFESGRFTTFTTLDGKLFVDRSGTLWIGTSATGLSSYKEGRFTHFLAGSGSNIISINQAADGTIICGATNPTSLIRISNSKPETLNIPDLHRSAINQMLVNRDGSILFATDEGVKELRQDKVVTLKFSNSSPGQVQSIFKDHEGSLWLGTRQQGLTRVRYQPFTSYTSDSGLEDKLVGALCEDSSGAIWIGQPSGLTSLIDGKLKRLEAEAPTGITSLTIDHRGVMWVGTSTGLFEKRADSFHKFTEAGADIRALWTDSAGVVWVGTNNNGLVRIEGDRTTIFTTRDGLPVDAIRSIYEDSRKNLWIGTFGGGLSKYSNGRFTRYGRREGLVNDYVMAIHEAAGALWIGTRNGLNRLKDGRFTSYSVNNGLFADSILHIVDDDYGNLWLSSNRGLFSVSLTDMNNFAERKSGSFTSKVYGERDGIRSRECTNTSLKGHDKKLYFGTFDGLVVVNPAELTQNRAVPQVHIEEIRLDKREVQIEPRLNLSAHIREIEIHYTALSFLEPMNTRFKYMLEGYDSNWVDVGTRRVAYYTNLSPGRYTFKVIGSNNDGVWNQRGDSLSFYVKPYFYQTYGFYAVVIMVLATMIWLVHRWRVQFVASHYRDIVAERTRIAREIHDTLAQGLVGISNQMDGAMALIKRDINRATQQLEMSRKMARHYASEARRSVWALRSHALDEYGLPTALSIIANQLTESHYNEIHVKVEGKYRKLPGHIEHNLLRIGQEAVVNAVKHARATNICLTLEYWPDSSRLTIRDDGRGFDAEGVIAEDSFGLIGMRERAESIGAEINIRSERGSGTVVTVDVKK